MEIRIYFEGHKGLRDGFKNFCSELDQKARAARCRLEFVAAKDGPRDYRKALKSHPTTWNILLKDSEGPMLKDLSSLCTQHGIDPLRAGDVFWMVQLMESWFLSDPQTVEEYYRHPNFSANALGQTADVEQIPKAEVQRRLREATKNTSKGEYSKVKHAPELLKRLDPIRVRRRAPNCDKLFQEVLARF